MYYGYKYILKSEGIPISNKILMLHICLSKCKLAPNVYAWFQEIVVGSNMDKIYIVMDYVEHDLKSLMQTMKDPFTIGKCNADIEGSLHKLEQNTH